MKLSIIISLFNRLDLTKNLWKSILENGILQQNTEIIWIDDGSQDGTRDWIVSLPKDRVRFIFNEHNCGFAASNNIGARSALGNVLCFLNNDLVLTEGSIELLNDVIQKRPEIGLVGNVQLRVATGKIDHAGICFDLLGLPDHRKKGRCLSSVTGVGCIERAVTAACCAIRRDLFLAAGGFDERYRNGCEDVDLCLRLGEMGYRHWVDYRSVVYHHVSSSSGRKDYELRNQAVFLKRWGHLTSKWGQEDWPVNYLSKHLHCSWKLNGKKTVDALLRLAGLRHGDSKWATGKREKIMALIDDVAQNQPSATP